MRYQKSTHGIKVQVQPRYSLADSQPESSTFVFSYRVNMSNEGDAPARLLFRHWLIHDATGEDSVVDGEGVVGEQPLLAPGDSHQYRSYCVLRSPIGYMEGYYTFVRPNGEEFRVEIPRFHLQGPLVIPSGVPEDMDAEADPGPMH